MFVVSPDPFMVPAYRISPFKTEHVGLNNQLPDDDFAAHYFDGRFGKGSWQYTYNGREAIELALEYYQLKNDDVVTILTTSENFYISSCVTKSIEKFCRWNRELTAETKLVFINHEFGYPYTEMEKIQATGLPIIEDCCTTFFSQDKRQNIGAYGDFSVYSFPKFFPIQIGGLLVNNGNGKTTSSSDLNAAEQNYIQNVLSQQLQNIDALLDRKKQNFEYASAQFSKLGFSLRFQNDQNTVPSVLLLNNNGVVADLNKLKAFLFENGIQNSVFYGEDAFFVPNHQNMEAADIDFICACIKVFINQKL
ncbi:MAG: DegT/DnrJ/EryC1/StrS family aminotransferase [Flavobacterium sp.]